MDYEINKPYKTKDGFEARIYATDAGGDYPIHGAIRRENGWDTATCTRDGSYNKLCTCHQDLMPLEETREVWINIYPEGCTSHANETEAAHMQMDTLVARKKVTLTFMNGDLS